MRPINNLKLAIGIPCSFPHVPISFVYSLLMMERPDFVLIHADNGGIDALRNDIVQKAQAAGANKLLMLDTDQVYPVDTVTRLLSHNVPVVGAVVHRRYPPFDPIMLKQSDMGWEDITDFKYGDLVEVDATGGACVLIDMQVFKKLPYPWFKFRKQENGTTMGEDIGFCLDAKKAGYKIYVDTAVEVEHLTTMSVNKNTNRLYNKLKEMRFKDLDRAFGKQLKVMEKSIN